MTMGLSMARHDESVLDPHVGDVHWLDEDDRHVNPMGSKGIGDIGIVGTAASIANTVYHATGIRVRELPITLDKLLR
jgi:xanthine dehydrogenase YagR molybdenum-binding subunit